jgi:hypothetical protein
MLKRILTVAALTNCTQLSKDCQVNGLGNNTYLQPPPIGK